MAQDENTFMGSSNNLYFEDLENEDGKQLNLEESLKSNLAGLIEARFTASELARDTDENRWMTAYHNFRGIYPQNVKFRESEKSRVFIKVTKTKVLAAFGQLVDVIAEGNFSADTHTFTWNADNLASGVYFISTQVNNSIENQKVMLIK